jgi:hypothetical protein
MIQQQQLLLQALEARIEVIQHHQDAHQVAHHQLLLQALEVQTEAMQNHQASDLLLLQQPTVKAKVSRGFVPYAETP